MDRNGAAITFVLKYLFLRMPKAANFATKYHQNYNRIYLNNI